jgi:hypothetical protein
MATFFDKQNNMCSDSCWEEAQNYGNNKINDYYTFSTQFVECKEPNVRMPDFYYDHVNLRGRPGYGLADACLIDDYSHLVNNSDSVTRDRCRLQLFKRLFNGCPLFKGQSGNIDAELDLLAGTDSGLLGGVGKNNIGCSKKGIMELQIKQPIPLVDCMKDIQNPDHIVPLWTRGGENTRSYINRLNFNNNII